MVIQNEENKHNNGAIELLSRAINALFERRMLFGEISSERNFVFHFQNICSICSFELSKKLKSGFLKEWAKPPPKYPYVSDSHGEKTEQNSKNAPPKFGSILSFKIGW